MARGRSTPYRAPLAQFLAAHDGQPDHAQRGHARAQFDQPPHQRQGTNIGGIHKALMKEFAGGALITFVDDHGVVLRGEDAQSSGWKAIAQPQLCALPGKPWAPVRP